MVSEELKKIFKLIFPKKPEDFLLATIGAEILKKVKNVFLYATAAARLVYVKYWKEKISPTKEQWLHKLTEFASIVAKIRNWDEKKTRNEWDCLEEYLKKDGIKVNFQAGINL